MAVQRSSSERRNASGAIHGSIRVPDQLAFITPIGTFNTSRSRLAVKYPTAENPASGFSSQFCQTALNSRSGFAADTCGMLSRRRSASAQFFKTSLPSVLSSTVHHMLLCPEQSQTSPTITFSALTALSLPVTVRVYGPPASIAGSVTIKLPDLPAVVSAVAPLNSTFTFSPESAQPNTATGLRR